MSLFTKFPRTPHVCIWSAAARDDKLMPAAKLAELRSQPASAEEKVDGANLGISVTPNGRLQAQSRGHYLEHGTAGQWKSLWRWLAVRESALTDALADKLILFGEWCYATHTVRYDALPDWFLAFDVYDRAAGRFWSRQRRDELTSRLGLSVVPLLAVGDVLGTPIGRSRLGDTQAEGIYFRWDAGDWLRDRGKVVRAGWVPASDEHWSRRPLMTNKLKEN